MFPFIEEMSRLNLSKFPRV